MVLDDAMKKAVEDCLKESILTDFLNKHKGEVINMLVTEWDRGAWGCGNRKGLKAFGK
jgi:hypothetical protein